MPFLHPLGAVISRETAARYQSDEAKMGYAPLGVVALAGTLAGFGVLLTPCLLLAGVNLFVSLTAGANSLASALIIVKWIMQPTALSVSVACGLLGAITAIARRLSIQHAWFWSVEKGVTMRIGLDDIFAMLAGTAMLWQLLNALGAGLYFFWLCLVIGPFPGFVLHAVWDFLYTPIIRKMGRISEVQQVRLIMMNIARNKQLLELGHLLDYQYNTETGALEVVVEGQGEAVGARFMSLLENYHLPASVRRVNVRRIAG